MPDIPHRLTIDVLQDRMPTGMSANCIESCTRSWNHYLPSLRDYLEVGRGSPVGSTADKAWRAKENLATTE
jgi:hypothetical protein